MSDHMTLSGYIKAEDLSTYSPFRRSIFERFEEQSQWITKESVANFGKVKFWIGDDTYSEPGYLIKINNEERSRLDALRYVFKQGEWIWVNSDDEPEISGDYGGALDMFLDEFKTNTNTERSDGQE